MIGVVFTVIFRRYFLDDPKMIFADGVAAAVTIEVLDTEMKKYQALDVDRKQDGQRMRALGYSALASAIVDWLRDGMSLLPTLFLSQPYRAGFEWSLLNVGSGLLVGLNVGMSMLLGTLVITYGIGPWIIQSGIGQEIVQGQIADQYWGECQRLVAIAALQPDERLFLSSHCKLLEDMRTHNYFPIVLLWAMWPATGLMVAAAVMAVALRWRSIVDAFRRLHMAHGRAGEDMSLKAIVLWASTLTIALALIQQAHFGMSILQTIVSVLASIPLMLVGIRVLGETNTGPVSAMANALQVLFGIFWPTHVGLNLIAAGMAGNTSAQAEGTIQDFKTGKIIGSTPRILTYVQLAAVPIGAASVAIMYPLLVGKYGLGGDGLTAPTGIKLANMAVLLSRGFEALPRYALQATIAAVVAGVAIAIIREKLQAAWVGWIPSVAAFGFALVLPGDLNISIAAGGIAGWVWMKISRETYDRYAITLASGMIAGEALVAGLILPASAAFRVTPS
jgi:OPT family oligopeptide transporter